VNLLAAGEGREAAVGARDHALFADQVRVSDDALGDQFRMLDEIGLFDESFFLYCEDTDLGLRARWAAWECLYVPDAAVEHRYSHSAGKASGLKAYYVERNRLYLAVKNFPISDLLLAPFYSTIRYFWHFVFAMQGRGKAADFQRDGNSAAKLPLYGTI